MTDELDTAEIRAAAMKRGPLRNPDSPAQTVVNLCDALDAARARIQELHNNNYDDTWQERCEAAEARIAELTTREQA